MRQYELAIRIAQVHHLVDERKYKKALAVIQTLDMRQVRSLSDLKVFAEVYTKTEQYEAAKATYLRIYRRSRTRRVLYRLIYLSIRTNALEDAEAYYQEFVRMNPNTRDVLILRYRIDKASGAPIGQLIEILQELKQEEYIEEWAYELAKLYHRAGRREECMEECEDILLWFGTGEIVERAKILIDHLKEKDPIPYYDDKDFTVPRKEEPNPDDTGSLPDLGEFIKERRAQKKEERLAERAARKAHAFEDDYDDMYEAEKVPKRRDTEEDDDGLVAFDKKEVFDREEPFDKEVIPVKKKEEQIKENKGNISKLPKEDKVSDDTFIDDYEEDDFEQDGLDLSQKIQKLSGLLKIGKKEEEQPKELPKEPQEKEGKKEEKEDIVREVPKSAYIPHSQSGTGITQDLAKEISAIYEMEQRDQLKEKAVTVIHDAPKSEPKIPHKHVSRKASKDAQNIATNVVDRMTQAIQKTAGKNYIPIDIEEIHGEFGVASETPEDLEKTKEVIIQEEVTKEFVAIGARKTTFREEPQEEPKDALMEALDEEVKQYYKSREQANQEEPVVKEEPVAIPEEPAVEEKPVTMPEEPAVEEEPVTMPEEPVVEEEPVTMSEEPAVEEEPVTMPEKPAVEEEPVTMPEKPAVEEAFVTTQKEPVIEQEEIAASKVAEEVLESIESEKSETELLRDLLEEEIQDPEDEEDIPEDKEEILSEKSEELLPEEGKEGQPEDGGELLQEEEEEIQPKDNGEALQEEEPAENALENYHAPEIPVVETDYMKVPEIAYEDLPTTRALQQSFKNVLKLIAGELDPSHFVLMGNGTDRIVGVSKQIVRVMKETGYLSQGRIAKIHAEQLNKMDLITFRSQLKGNCLLVEGAADLLFPTITKIFSIMEEYFGDFVVILADEGTTLDQLFRFVPVLAKKFKYIIDISTYTEDDYK